MYFNIPTIFSSNFGILSRVMTKATCSNFPCNLRFLSVGTSLLGRKRAEGAEESEKPIDFGRLDIRVGRVVAVRKHPNADSLYVTHVELGELQTRTIVAGLVKFVGLEELQNRLVVCLCNLRPSKKRGIDSHAMILCASTDQKVEPLELSDQSCPPGSLVVCPNFARQPDKVLKKNLWEQIASDLRVSDTGECVFRGDLLRVDGDNSDTSSRVIAPTLRNVPIN